jgi:YHS domain-containing protein
MKQVMNQRISARSTNRRRMTKTAGAALVLMLVLGAGPADPQPAAVKGDPYPLDTCAVAGTKLGSMGEPVIYNHQGREIRFCCKGCILAFEKDPEKYLKQVDEKIIEQQLPHYPLTTCIVMEKDPLDDPEIKPFNLVYNNRLVRFCCKGCTRDFKADPEPFLKKLDEAVIAAQKKQYPLETCVVGGGKLGSMGTPVEYVMHNRLVRLCCRGCVPSLRKDPVKYTAQIDAAQADGAEPAD